MCCPILDFVFELNFEVDLASFISPGNAVQILIAVIFIDSIPMCFRVHNLLLICLEEHHRLIHRKIC